jgi:drug/metabolite transporter (DMT)-like permease
MPRVAGVAGRKDQRVSEALLSGPALGQALAVCSALSFALANNFISRTSASGGDKGVMFSVLVTMGLSALLWLALESSEAGWPAARAEWIAVGWFAMAGVLAMVFGRTLVFESIRRLGVTRSSAVKRLNPFFSVLLAVLFLAEPLTGGDAIGIAAIALSFGLLIRESTLRGRDVLDHAPPTPAYLFGVFGAFAYAAAYIARKAGLGGLDAPALGTLISAVSGFAVFLALSPFSARHRRNLSGIFSHLDRWIVVGAIMVSFGQIFLFAALAFETVSTVVMIASMEIFVSIFLSVFIFKSEPWPRPAVLVAAVLAMVGVVLIAMR